MITTHTLCGEPVTIRNNHVYTMDGKHLGMILQKDDGLYVTGLEDKGPIIEAINNPIKEVKCVHSGQYHAYGDSFYVYEIYLKEGVDLDKEEILSYCFGAISRRKVQSRQEWQSNHYNPDKYFSGYYELLKTSYGYQYKVCLPYTD